ncbi:hypothetical protein BDW22DRAFT_1370486 [Trametopsis cervina]|nr:hypothetical protein BDW22DRAFT_1370486 [Trametopsis cervina]
MANMSLRQRSTYRSSDDDDSNGPILDEQEQEELINDLKEESQTRNTQYQYLLQVFIALSAVLHISYLLNGSGETPFAAILPRTAPSPPIPGASAFIFLALFVHANLSLHLVSPQHAVRSNLANTFAGHVPLRQPFIFLASLIAPVLAVCLSRSLVDVMWWCFTLNLAAFIFSAQRWFRQEAEAIQRLENMRYDARGA